MSTKRLVIHHFDPVVPGLGGIDTCIRGLVKYGSEATFSVVGMSRDGVDSNVRNWRRLLVKNSARKVPTLYVGRLADERTAVPNVARLLFGSLRLAGKIRTTTPDVVQVHRSESVSLARRLFPTAQLDFFLHEDARNWTPSTNSSRWRRVSWLHRQVIEHAATRADRVVCFSPSAVEHLAERHDHVLSVSTWFDPDLFRPVPRPAGEGVKLVWIGRFDTVKDPLLALEVLGKLPTNYSLTFVGDGSLRADLQNRITGMQLGRRVEFVGRVSQTDVARLLRAHHLLLMTSHSEGFPRVLIEALASGRPVVATAGADTGKVLVEGMNGGRSATRDAGELAALVEEAHDASPEACSRSVADLSAPAVVGRILGPEHV